MPRMTGRKKILTTCFGAKGRSITIGCVIWRTALKMLTPKGMIVIRTVEK